MSKIFKITGYFSFSIVSLLFLFIPDDAWLCVKLLKNSPDYVNSIFNRIVIFLSVLLLCFLVAIFIYKIRFCCNLYDKNHNIQIRYGNILESKKGLILINFDECFTSKIGKSGGDIKEDSLCGQFIISNGVVNIDELLEKGNVKPEKNRKSKYQNKTCYKPGTILPYDKYLLMSFARLDKNGLAEFNSLNEYLDCLSYLWEEINVFHSESNVCVPVFGAGRTKFKDRELNQQELLDIMIFSYKMSEHRLKKPYKLIIYCKRDSDFSLNKINKCIYK